MIIMKFDFDVLVSFGNTIQSRHTLIYVIVFNIQHRQERHKSYAFDMHLNDMHLNMSSKIHQQSVLHTLHIICITVVVTTCIFWDLIWFMNVDVTIVNYIIKH